MLDTFMHITSKFVKVSGDGSRRCTTVTPGRRVQRTRVIQRAGMHPDALRAVVEGALDAG